MTFVLDCYNNKAKKGEREIFREVSKTSTAPASPVMSYRTFL